jgi:hypothetical protein
VDNFLKRVTVVVSTLVIMATMCSCNKGRDGSESIDKVSPGVEVTNTKNSPTIESTKGGNSSEAKNKTEEDSNLNYFKDLIQLGSYSEIIRLGGEQRDPKDVIIKDGKMTLPEGKVVTLIGTTPGKMKSFINVEKDKVKQLVSEMEKSKVVNSESVGWSLHDTVGATISILLINTSAEYIEIGVDLNGKNIHMFDINYEDPKKRVYNLCIQSEKLTNMIKELTGWKYVSNKDLDDIVKAKYKDLSYDANKEFELTKDEIKVLVDGVSNSTKKTLEYPSPRNIVIEAVKSNGETIHMIWSKEGGGMGIEGVHYQLSNESIKSLNNILTKNSTIPSK